MTDDPKKADIDRERLRSWYVEDLWVIGYGYGENQYVECGPEKWSGTARAAVKQQEPDVKLETLTYRWSFRTCVVDAESLTSYESYDEETGPLENGLSEATADGQQNGTSQPSKPLHKRRYACN